MKMHKFIFEYFPKILGLALLVALSLTAHAKANEQAPEKTMFLQDIESQLIRVGGLKDRMITLHITNNQKREIAITPSSISFSYGFLKQLNNINQLIATMAHMTAHISLDFVATPPLPEDEQAGHEKTSVTEYLKTTMRPKYPDQGNIPQATGAFHTKGAAIIERPGYYNKDYDYSMNKADIINAEHELEVDKITDKILRHAGYCPSDYSRMLHYFYENPQALLGNKHFALNANEWQRIDAVNRRVDPAVACSPDQTTHTQKHENAFDQLLVKIRQALRKKK